VVLAPGEYVDHDDLLLSTLKTSGDTESGTVQANVDPSDDPASLADIEKEHILRTLLSTGWNKSRSAGILGIERSTLDRKIRRYNLAAERPRAL